MEDVEGLAARYRPTDFVEVIGQKPAVDVLEIALEAGGTHAFLFSGPQGVGKTTLARLMAKRLGVLKPEEIAAAVSTGVDDMRDLVSRIEYKPFDADRRVVILDEAHRISKQAWDAALKAIEEPPRFVYWMLCTTEPNKLPKTIIDRCRHLRLQAVHKRDIRELLVEINDRECFGCEDDLLSLCATEAYGSVRAGIGNLEACYNLEWEVARAVLHAKQQDEGHPVIQLCLCLRSKGKWLRAVEIAATITEEPETARIIICNYFATCLINETNEREAIRLLGILERFSTPYHQGESLAPLLLSIGQVTLGGA